MIWQQTIKAIVQLEVDYFDYYPIQVGPKFTLLTNDQDFSIQLDEEIIIIKKKFWKRKLILKNLREEGQPERQIIHYAYDWPDFSAPTNEMDIIEKLVNAMHEVEMDSNKNGSAIAVHCMAGHGRTGTLLASCIITQMLKLWAKEYGNVMKTFQISIFGLVRRLREQRFKMVGTKGQYYFIYKFAYYYLQKLKFEKQKIQEIKIVEPDSKYDLSRYILTGPFSNDPKLKDFSYELVKKQGLHKYEEGFSLCDFLENVSHDQVKEEFQILKQICTSQSDIHQNIPTKFFSRNPQNQEQQITASYIHGCTQNSSQAYIATQNPMKGTPKTVNEFWQSMWKQKVNLIIMLTNYEERNKYQYVNYFPFLPKECLRLEGFQITCNVCYDRGYLERELIIKKLNQETDEERLIKHISNLTWPDNIWSNKNQMDLNQVLEITKITQNQRKPYAKQPPIVVHCDTGTNKTGAFVACDIIADMINLWKEEFKNEIFRDTTFKISIFGIVRRLREQRYMVVSSLAQYEFIYQFLRYFLQEHLKQNNKKHI